MEQVLLLLLLLLLLPLLLHCFSHFRIEFSATVAASLEAASKVSATYQPSLTASTGIVTGYHKDRGLYLDQIPFKLADASKPFEITAGCSLDASAELAVGPKLIVGVGPSLLAKFTTKTDLLSVTVPRYAWSFEAGANIQAKDGYPTGCKMCNSACPHFGTKGKVKHALGAKVMTLAPQALLYAESSTFCRKALWI
jgi:hypothetical protein